MNWIVPLIWPILLHMAVSEVTAVLLRGRMDAASITAVTSIIVIPAAVWMYRKDLQREKDYVRENFPKPAGEKQAGERGIPFGIFCFLTGGIMNLAWSSILNLLHIQELFSNQTQESLLASRMLIQIVGLGILVPVAEELIFRGLIYKRMKHFLSVRKAVLFSALLFAVYHGNPIQMIFAFPMAAVLAVVLEHGRWIVFPILFHMGANLTAVFTNILF